MINLVLFGKPGAGKGATQAEFLKSHYQLVHISTGDVFRYNIKNATDLGKLAQSYMDKKDLVENYQYARGRSRKKSTGKRIYF